MFFKLIIFAVNLFSYGLAWRIEHNSWKHLAFAHWNQGLGDSHWKIKAPCSVADQGLDFSVQIFFNFRFINETKMQKATNDQLI